MGGQRPGSTLGVGEYLLAVMVSLGTLAVEIGVVELIQQHDAALFWYGVLIVVSVGLVPAAIIGSIGATIVHYTTRTMIVQTPAVVIAGLVGFLAGLLVFWGQFGFATLLAIAAAVGRLAIVPRAHAASRTLGSSPGTGGADPTTPEKWSS